MAVRIQGMCSSCHAEQSVDLPADTKSFICNQCLSVTTIDHLPSQGPQISSHLPSPSASPSSHYSLISGSVSDHPHISHSHSSVSVLPTFQDHSNYLLQRDHSWSSNSLPSVLQIPQQQLKPSQSTSSTSPSNQYLHVPQFQIPSQQVDSLPSAVPTTKYQSLQNNPQPSSSVLEVRNPFLPPLFPRDLSPASNNEKPSPVGTLSPPHHKPVVLPLPTRGVQLYRRHSTPNPLQYTPTPANSQGSKRAVICGITYRGTCLELKGCLNDANCMKYLLSTRFHFPDSSILMLTEEQMDPRRQPTKYNIMHALEWLVQGCQPGDSLVFHFSGHGSQQINYNGEELDGYDETLIPMDFQTAGPIVDDDINSTIVRPLPVGVTLHAIVDACHSGTVLDLPYLYRYNGYEQFTWEDHRPTTGTWKGTAGGDVYSFSGCDDNQTVVDTSDLAKGTSTGEMTYCFIQAIERGYGSTYGSLLNAMRSAVHSAENQLVTSLIDKLLTGGSYEGGETQEPQLTASKTFDVSKPFIL